jgi:hypothetical protein
MTPEERRSCVYTFSQLPKRKASLKDSVAFSTGTMGSIYSLLRGKQRGLTKEEVFLSQDRLSSLKDSPPATASAFGNAVPIMLENESGVRLADATPETLSSLSFLLAGVTDIRCLLYTLADFHSQLRDVKEGSATWKRYQEHLKVSFVLSNMNRVVLARLFLALTFLVDLCVASDDISQWSPEQHDSAIFLLYFLHSPYLLPEHFYKLKQRIYALSKLAYSERVLDRLIHVSSDDWEDLRKTFAEWVDLGVGESMEKWMKAHLHVYTRSVGSEPLMDGIHQLLESVESDSVDEVAALIAGGLPKIEGAMTLEEKKAYLKAVMIQRQLERRIGVFSYSVSQGCPPGILVPPVGYPSTSEQSWIPLRKYFDAIRAGKPDLASSICEDPSSLMKINPCFLSCPALAESEMLNEFFKVSYYDCSDKQAHMELKTKNGKSRKQKGQNESESPYGIVFRNYAKLFAQAFLGLALIMRIAEGRSAQPEVCFELQLGDVSNLREQFIVHEKKRKSMGLPLNFLRVHLNSVADYTGLLSVFTFAFPLLMRDPQALIITNVHHAHEVRSMDEATQASCLLPNLEALGETLGVVFSIASVPYGADWTIVSNKPTFRGLCSLEELEQWLHRLYLTIILPPEHYPCSPSDGKRDYSDDYPMNVVTFLYVIFLLHHDMKYPAHWLSSILSDLLSSTLRTKTAFPEEHPIDADYSAPCSALEQKAIENVTISFGNLELRTLIACSIPLLRFSVIPPKGFSPLPNPFLVEKYSLHLVPNGGYYSVPGRNAQVLAILLVDPSKISVDPHVSLRASFKRWSADSGHLLTVMEWKNATSTASFWLSSADMHEMQDWVAVLIRMDVYIPVSEVASMASVVRLSS